MKIVFLLLRRSLIPRKDSILSYALWLSTLGVALGVGLLVLVLAVMEGFQEMLQAKYTKISSELVVLPMRNEEISETFKEKLMAIKGVKAVAPFEFGQGMLFKSVEGAKGRGGVTLEGINLADSVKVSPIKEIISEGPDLAIHRKQRNWIWVGSQLAKRLNIKMGDDVSLLIADHSGKRVVPFKVSAITKFGIYEHDLRYATVDLKVLQELFQRTGKEPMYKVLVSGETDANTLRLGIREAFDDGVTVKLWNEINRNIFMAVEHQKGSLFLMLQIIVILAAVNVMNLLLMTSNQRRRDVAILRAMGMKAKHVFLYFFSQGGIVGALGIGSGIGLGLLCCFALEKFQPTLLSEEIYNVSTVPFRVVWADVLTIALWGMVICLTCSVLPALRAAMKRPVQVLRYE